MKTDTFYEFLHKPETLNLAKYNELKLLLSQFPWSVHLQLLELFYLKQNDKTAYQKKLENTIFMFPDRRSVYNYLYKKVSQNSFIDIDLPEEYTVVNENNNNVEQETQTGNSNYTIDEENNENVDLMSVVMSRLSEIANENAETDEKSNKEEQKKPKYLEQIEKFIENEPTIRFDKMKLDNDIDFSEAGLAMQSDIVTETLANLYVSQGQHERAIEIFKKLIIKYPEKSSYFANQIEKLQKLNT